jgi:hypothetical protein
LLSPVYFTRTVYFTRILYCFPLDTLITFVSSKPVRLTTSSQVENKVLGCVVCRFRVAASKQSLDETPYINCPKLSQTSKHHLQLFVSSLQERLNLGFLTEGKLAAILITPSSWGSQRAGYSPRARTVCYASTWHQQLLGLTVGSSWGLSRSCTEKSFLSKLCCNIGVRASSANNHNGSPLVAIGYRSQWLKNLTLMHPGHWSAW